MKTTVSIPPISTIPIRYSFSNYKLLKTTKSRLPHKTKARVFISLTANLGKYGRG